MKRFLHLIRKALYLLLLMALLDGCQTETFITVINPDLIFEEALHISVPPYNYRSNNGNVFYLQADSLKPGQSDTINQIPHFRWENENIPYVFVAIFNDTIISNKTSILNPEDMVWFWHNGMNNMNDTLEPGNINYYSGKKFTGSFESNIPPDTLAKGQNYMWGVWGWNKAAKKIAYSSKRQKFTVR